MRLLAFIAFEDSVTPTAHALTFCFCAPDTYNHFSSGSHKVVTWITGTVSGKDFEKTFSIKKNIRLVVNITIGKTTEV